jgi:hypothetical protein
MSEVNSDFSNHAQLYCNEGAASEALVPGLEFLGAHNYGMKS